MDGYENHIPDHSFKKTLYLATFGLSVSGGGGA